MLFEVIDRLVGSVSPSGVAASRPDVPDDGLIDRLGILARVDGDRKLLSELVALFRGDAPRLLAEARDAVARTDAEALEHAAHTLKGSVGNFSAGAALEAARRVETLAREGRWAAAGEALSDLEREIARLEPGLNALVKEVPS